MLKKNINKLGIFLTRRCNFDCVYCCSEKGADPPDKLTLDEWQGLLAQARGLGCRRVVIAGAGEPTMDDLLLPLIESAQKCGMACDVTTNGSLIDKKAAAWFLERRVRIFIKLDSLDPATQDLLTQNKPSFKREPLVIKGKVYVLPSGIKNLIEAGYSEKGCWGGIGGKLSVATVITRFNIGDIPDIVRFCAFCGIGIYIEELLPLGRAKEALGLIPDKDDVQRLFSSIRPYLNVTSRLWLQRRCDFETSPFFDSNGDIRSCFGLGESCGNIRQKPLAQLCREQMRVRDRRGKPSPFLKWRSSGFRHCRTRRMLEPCAP